MSTNKITKKHATKKVMPLYLKVIIPVFTIVLLVIFSLLLLHFLSTPKPTPTLTPTPTASYTPLPESTQTATPLPTTDLFTLGTLAAPRAAQTGDAAAWQNIIDEIGSEGLHYKITYLYLAQKATLYPDFYGYTNAFDDATMLGFVTFEINNESNQQVFLTPYYSSLILDNEFIDLWPYYKAGAYSVTTTGEAMKVTSPIGYMLSPQAGLTLKIWFGLKQGYMPARLEWTTNCAPIVKMNPEDSVCQEGWSDYHNWTANLAAADPAEIPNNRGPAFAVNIGETALLGGLKIELLRAAWLPQQLPQVTLPGFETPDSYIVGVTLRVTNTTSHDLYATTDANLITLGTASYAERGSEIVYGLSSWDPLPPGGIGTYMFWSGIPRLVDFHIIIPPPVLNHTSTTAPSDTPVTLGVTLPQLQLYADYPRLWPYTAQAALLSLPDDSSLPSCEDAGYADLKNTVKGLIGYGERGLIFEQPGDLPNLMRLFAITSGETQALAMQRAGREYTLHLARLYYLTSNLQLHSLWYAYGYTDTEIWNSYLKNFPDADNWGYTSFGNYRAERDEADKDFSTPGTKVLILYSGWNVSKTSLDLRQQCVRNPGGGIPNYVSCDLTIRVEYAAGLGSTNKFIQTGIAPANWILDNWYYTFTQETGELPVTGKACH